MTERYVDFYFDYSSPFAYLGATQIERVAREQSARVVYKPMLLGGLFKLIGTPDVPLASFSEPKRKYYGMDLSRWADHWGVPLRFPTRFPIRSIAPLRLTLAAQRHPYPTHQLIKRLFEAAWVRNEDIADPSLLESCLDELDMPRELLEQTQDPAIKEELKSLTTTAAQTGVCGAPTFGVEEMLFWGQDRLDFVARALDGWRPSCG